MHHRVLERRWGLHPGEVDYSSEPAQRILSAGGNPNAARLLNVDPTSNTETLLARGLYRIDPKAPNGRQVFQLHPGAWHFAAGQIPELELLGKDAPYSRPSNGTFTIKVTDLQLRLPVHEVPGARGTPPMVSKPLPAVTPTTSEALLVSRDPVAPLPAWPPLKHASRHPVIRVSARMRVPALVKES